MCLSLAATKPASAEYKNPETGDDAPNSQTTSIAATRGVCNSSADSPEQKASSSTTLTALAPYSHVGQSTANNPTFTWYVPDPEPYPIKFKLYELSFTDDSKNKRTEIYEVELKNTSGIMTHSLPTEQVNLIPGKTYLWQITVVCSRANPSDNIIVRNQIKIVEADPTMTTQISAIKETDRVAKANIYAQSGLWYNALAEVATAQNDPQARDYIVELISQLAAIEENSSNLDIKIVNSHQENLKQIIEAITKFGK